MKRLLVPSALLLVLGALALWLAGRAPSRYVLKQECRRFQAERVKRFRRIAFQIGREEAAQIKAGGAGAEGAAGAELARLEAERERVLVDRRVLRFRGWEACLIPPGAPPPAAAGFLVALRVDPSGAEDPAPLRGEMEVWVAPRGSLARLLHALGLTP